jgi:hypothetical protein
LNTAILGLGIEEKMADCNQPTVIRPSYSFAVNPFRVSKNLFARIYDNEFEKGQLAKVIDAWRKAFKLDCID